MPLFRVTLTREVVAFVLAADVRRANEYAEAEKYRLFNDGGYESEVDTCIDTGPVTKEAAITVEGWDLDSLVFGPHEMDITCREALDGKVPPDFPIPDVPGQLKMFGGQ